VRGTFEDQGGLFSYIAPEARVPTNHPLRKIRALVRDVLGELNRSLGKLYASEGRPSIPPEQLLSALLLQVFYGIRSERQLMEQLDYNLLYRWFVGLSPDDPIWDPTTFTKNRDRLVNGEVFAEFMTKLLNHPQVKPLLSDEHFSVDGTLIEAWASHKSFRPKDGSGAADGGANFHGQQRRNDTHASISDPNSRLYRKAAGREAKLCYMRHATMENRHGLAVAGMVTLADGTAERRASEIMLKAKAKEAGRRITVGEDKAYDTADHVGQSARPQRHAACDTERQHHRNRQAPPERHRWTYQDQNGERGRLCAGEHPRPGPERPRPLTRSAGRSRLCRPPENKADLHMGPFLAARGPNTALVQGVGYGVQTARSGFLDFSNQRQQICGKLIGAALAGGRAACGSFR
jgi:transposase